MSNRIMTLFGEEVIPEQINAVGKSRAAKKEKSTPVAEETITETAAAKPKRKKEVAHEEPVVASPASPIPDDWKGDKQYYSIGEVAALFTVKTSNIRFWTTEFAIKVRTTRKGDRLYTPAQVKQLRTIHHLVKEQGFTINGAKARLKSQKKKDVETIDLKQSLLQLRNKLLTIRNQLK